MLWYLSFLFGILLSVMIGKGYLNKNNLLFFYYILPLFICFGYMIGADWRMYEVEFYDVTERQEIKEPGYYILSQFFYTIGWGFWEFTIVYKLIGYYVFLYVFKSLSNNTSWGLLYWFPNYALFLWMDHPARNFIAVIIFSCALLSIEKGNLRKFLLLYILASFVHSTCILMLPIYFVVRKTPVGKYNYWLIATVAIYFVAELMRTYLAPLLEAINMMQRMQGYLLEEEYAKKMSIVRFLIFFAILYLGSIKIENIRKKTVHADFILKLSFLYVFFFSIGNIHNIFFRFQYFLMIPICVQICYLCMYVESTKIKMAFRMFVVLFAFVYTQNLITRDTHYIPYSNYLEYVFKDKPSYNQRSDYNPTHSPYKDKEE